MSQKVEPWNPTEATYAIREIAQHPALSVAYKVHATQRLIERGLIVSDILYLMKNGFVLKDAKPATKNGYFKYNIECSTPNSNGRQICAVVIPNFNSMTIKIVTVFWVDETDNRSGTLMEVQK
ncbi:DUF4258 domain-containing protein [Parasulfitobacter algicola]|uniref:DUF4258 domain-containing protein n=1 Tax=Parasulfitobacter algicola TaxID=2614809 RepID=A0ABX2INX8_9RHOB|nr:DUF4258 domain-containing protein [Sulfitobacter algicola]NSX54599.1 DUF4258 domain-containing protein [Sulfitobacter algicola]